MRIAFVILIMVSNFAYSQKAKFLIIAMDQSNFKIENLIESCNAEQHEPINVSMVLQNGEDRNTFNFKAAIEESDYLQNDSIAEQSVRLTFDDFQEMTPFKIHELLLYYAGAIYLEHNYESIKPKLLIALYQGDTRIIIQPNQRRGKQ